MVKTLILCGGQPVMVTEMKTATNPNPRAYSVGETAKVKITAGRDGMVSLDVRSVA